MGPTARLASCLQVGLGIYAREARRDPLSHLQNEVLPNPLNLSKPCVLASGTSPVESVMLGAGPLSKDVVAAQLECSQRSEEAVCTKDQVRRTRLGVCRGVCRGLAAEPTHSARC